MMENPEHVPVVHSTIASDPLVKILETDYRLDATVECRLWDRGFNDQYLVTAGERKYMLRIYSARKYWVTSEDELRFELDLLAHLHKKQVPVSYAIRRRDGDLLGTLQAPEGVRHFALFTYAEGRPLPAVDPEHAPLVGENLARLHLACNDFRTCHSRYHLDMGLLVDQPVRLIERHMGDARKKDWESLSRLAERLKRQVLALAISGDGYGVIHADVHEGNLHFIDGSGLVFFDFDHCGYGWRAYDIAGCLTGEPLETVTAFLDGYQTVRRLSAAEAEAIPLFVKIRRIWDTGDNLARIDVEGGQWVDDRHWNKLLEQLRE
jgi:Ser/Thr protein kinase RdoA (MazF antagonist)